VFHGSLVQPEATVEILPWRLSGGGMAASSPPAPQSRKLQKHEKFAAAGMQCARFFLKTDPWAAGHGEAQRSAAPARRRSTGPAKGAGSGRLFKNARLLRINTTKRTQQKTT
jgi:hypothetical protein